MGCGSWGGNSVAEDVDDLYYHDHDVQSENLLVLLSDKAVSIVECVRA